MKNKHLHPKLQKTITAVTLFSGVGGGTFGLLYNHIKEILAVDNWKVAQKAFEANFPDIPFWMADLSRISAQDIMERAEIKAGELSILLSSPPCQGFSRASGKVNSLDTRNALFGDTIDFISGMQPKCFIIENVPGMTDDRLVAIFNEIKHKIHEKLMPNYEVRCFELLALNYNTPQKRRRLIYVGYRKEFGVIPTPPKPDYEAINGLRIADVAPEITAIKVGQSKKTFKHNTKHMTTITASDALQVYSNGVEQSLSVEQDKRFATFPESYKIPSGISKGDAHRLFGNTIPPMFMKSIVEHILEEIGDKL